ncbi:hypothetical protein [Tunturiibacter empetritectus]|uniref:hypothetical protein n=1 Tax=Tunturiibacter empetritectus TaxID=3069691 RepID=UPI003D9BDC4F
MKLMDLAAKSAKLHETLQQLGSVLVAYSGGTDSAYLAYAAHQALGDNMQAVIADSASLPRAELAAALAFAADHNIPIQVLRTDELENPDYQRNDALRCFHCKDELFQQMEQTRAARNFAHIAYGMNLDDRAEFRPGQQAAAHHHAVAPSSPPASPSRRSASSPSKPASPSGTSPPAPASPPASSTAAPSPAKISPRSSRPKTPSTPSASPRSASATTAISPASKSPATISPAPSPSPPSKPSPPPSSPSASSTSPSTPKATAPAP